MANFNGNILTSPFRLDAEPYIVQTRLQGIPVDFSNISGINGLMSGGYLSLGYPQYKYYTTMTGDKLESFYNLFYDRIWITPSGYDFKFLAKDTVVSLKIWNAYFISKIINSITNVDANNCEVTGVAPPYSMRALEELNLTCIAHIAGNPSFNGKFVFDFASGESGQFTVKGVRIVAFCHRPHNSYSEGHVWATAIYISDNKSERRVSLLNSKLFRSDFKISATDYRAVNRLQSASLFGLDKLFGVPLWYSMTKLTQNVNPGAVVIYADTSNCEFSPDYVVLWKDNFNFEIAKKVSYASDRITLESGIVGSFTTSDYIIPVYIGTTRNNQQLTFEFGNFVKEIDFGFMELQ